MARRRARRGSGTEELEVITGPKGRFTQLGYRAASVARRDGLVFTSGSGDAHTRWDRGELVKQSRQFYRDNGLYRGLIDRAVTNIVGRGFALQAAVGTKDLRKKVEALWKQYMKRPEVRQLQSGRRVQAMVCREALVAGDVGAVKIGKGVKRGYAQLIEAERIARLGTGGVDLDAFGAPRRFWVSNYSDSGYLDTNNAKPYGADDFLFVPAGLERPSQTRGVPVCQASFAMLHRIADVCDSEALAWQMLARLAFAVTKESAAQNAYDTSRSDPDKTDTDTEGDLGHRLHDLDVALIFHGKKGEKVEGIERNIPGQNFSESLRMFLRLLGLPLGIPLEIILLDWSEANYSSARASLEQAFATFEDYQQLLEDEFWTPLFEWKVSQWVAEDKLPDREDIAAHSWVKPSFPWIDQLKECQAWGAKLDRGLATYGKALKSLGDEREEVLDIREREIEDAIERAKRIEAKHGVKVPWQMLAGVRPPGEKGNPDDLADKRDPEAEPRQPKEKK